MFKSNILFCVVYFKPNNKMTAIAHNVVKYSYILSYL